MKKYTNAHEWIEESGDGKYRVGITDYAQGQLGDVVSVELPDPGKELKKGEDCAVIESVKAASDIYTPVSGEITLANNSLENNPGLVNESPESEGWLWEMTLSDPSELEELMDESAYQKCVEQKG